MLELEPLTIAFIVFGVWLVILCAWVRANVIVDDVDRDEAANSLRCGKVD